MPMDKLCPKALVGIATMPAKIALITKKARLSINDYCDTQWAIGVAFSNQSLAHIGAWSFGTTVPQTAPSGGGHTVAPRRVPMKEGRVVSACLSAASITSSPSSQGAPRGDRRESPSDHFEDEMRVRTPVPDGCTRVYRGRAFKHTAV